MNGAHLCTLKNFPTTKINENPAVELSFGCHCTAIFNIIWLIFSGDTPFYADSLVGTYGECRRIFSFHVAKCNLGKVK